MADAYLTRRGSVVKTGATVCDGHNNDALVIPGLTERMNAMIMLCDENLYDSTAENEEYITAITVEKGVITGLTAVSESSGLVFHSLGSIHHTFEIRFVDDYGYIEYANDPMPDYGDPPYFAVGIPYKCILY